MKKMPKKIILSVIIIAAAAIIYQVFLKKENSGPELFEVKRGNVLQEVSEAGKVQKGEKINLNFKNAGRIEEIYVKAGQKVKAGELLARTGTADLLIQLKEANSALAINQAKLDKLFAGASREEIQKAETAVSNAESDLKDAEQNFKDVRAGADDDLDAALGDALNDLEEGYLKADKARTTVDAIQKSYFTGTDQESLRTRENQGKITAAVLEIKNSLDKAKENSIDENINEALLKIKEKLQTIENSLRVIRDICDEPAYNSNVSSADKTLLDTQRTNINTAAANVTDARQTISSTKITNETNINAAQAKITAAQGDFQTAKDELALLTAPPGKEDVDLYQAQVDQAEAQVENLENQITEAGLKSPVDGQIAEVKKRTGELVQPGSADPVIVFLPSAPFEIKADIYEEDVVWIDVGNSVDIFLVAFSGNIFKGKVININPAEKLIDDVVYYETLIDFEEAPEGLKPGMTADLVIKAVSKENVLAVPADSIIKKDSRIFVEVYKDGAAEEREIEIGLEGSNDLVEVVFGLAEGEKVVIQ